MKQLRQFYSFYERKSFLVIGGLCCNGCPPEWSMWPHRKHQRLCVANRRFARKHDPHVEIPFLEALKTI